MLFPVALSLLDRPCQSRLSDEFQTGGDWPFQPRILIGHQQPLSSTKTGGRARTSTSNHYSKPSVDGPTQLQSSGSSKSLSVPPLSPSSLHLEKGGFLSHSLHSPPRQRLGHCLSPVSDFRQQTGPSLPRASPASFFRAHISTASCVCMTNRNPHWPANSRQ